MRDKCVLLKNFHPTEFYQTAENYFVVNRGGLVNPFVCRAAIEQANATRPYVERVGHEICHMFMAKHYMHATYGMSGIYTSLWTKYEKDLANNILYWSFILDPIRSPWREILTTRDGRQAKIINDHLNRPLCVYIPVDNHTSAQLLENLLIATRTGFEKPQNTRLFAWMVEHGLSLYEALYVSIWVQMDDNGKTWQVPLHGHYPFNINTNIKLKQIMDCAPKFGTNKIALAESPFPCNIIWQDFTFGGTSKLLGFLKHAEPYAGAFPKQFKRRNYGGTVFHDSVSSDPKVVLNKFIENREALL